jgi:hypothetical protein
MMRRLVRAAIRNATITRSEGVTLRADPLIVTVDPASRVIAVQNQ